MVHHITNYFSKRYLPRWIVLVFDVAAVLFTFLTAYTLRFNFDLMQVAEVVEFNQLFLIQPVYLFSFWLLKSYSGIIRLSTSLDIVRIIFSLSLAGVILFCISFFLRKKSKVINLYLLVY